jgi:hypothetical protein
MALTRSKNNDRYYLAFKPRFFFEHGLLSILKKGRAGLAYEACM